MFYYRNYESPLGLITIGSDETGIVGLWFEEQKYINQTMPKDMIERPDFPILVKSAAWLDDYFEGRNPSVDELEFHPSGSEFRQIIWKLLLEIPYGQVTTYGELGKKAAKILGREKMSAQAVGGAVGHNPISIMVPCHRVIGADGSLTGYAGGLHLKEALLKLEGYL